MSAPIEQLRKTARIPMEDHLAIFDHYVALGRDVESLAIKFGYDIPIITSILEGYGETVCEASRGRLRMVHQALVREYVERFYPGIASENPENDWIHIEAYLDVYHSGWREEMERQERAHRRKWKSKRLFY